jgi:hypothetical protein
MAPAAPAAVVCERGASLPPPSRRLVNLELLQQHGAKLWVAQNNNLEASAAQLERADSELAGRIETVNRKRKADQQAVAQTLSSLEGEWVTAVKKNLELEAQNLSLEAECAALRERVEKRARG